MKVALSFDPEAYDYGPATPAIREILRVWASADWFAPFAGDAARMHAVAAASEHVARTRAHLPSLLPERLDVTAHIGDWGAFAALCARVRASGAWDWKFAVLKPLARDHAASRGWSIEKEGALCANLEAGERPRPGDLFVRIGTLVLWTIQSHKLDSDGALPPDRGALAAWYMGYAHMDMVECIQWQLAERSASLEGNPFFPLLQCYASGFLPFGVDARSLVVFGLAPS